MGGKFHVHSSQILAWNEHGNMCVSMVLIFMRPIKGNSAKASIHNVERPSSERNIYVACTKEVMLLGVFITLFVCMYVCLLAHSRPQF